MDEIPPAEIVGGRYRLTPCIGRGGMGTVWCAEHLSLRKTVAVKLLDAELAKRPELRSRFAREARAAAALESPNIVRILDHGEDGGLSYIVMEHLKGESLGECLKREGVISPELTAHVMEGLCEAERESVVHADPVATVATFATTISTRPPRVLILYGSLREKSFSRYLAEECGRVLTAFGAEVRSFDPRGLPVFDRQSFDLPKVKELRALNSACGRRRTSGSRPNNMAR